MHPVLASKRLLAAYAAAWIPLGTLLTLLLATGGMRAGQALAIAIPLIVVEAFICLAAWYPCRATPLATRRVLRVLGTHLAAAVGSSALWVLAGAAWVQALARLPGFAAASEVYTRQAPLLFVFGGLLFLLAVAVHYAAIAVDASRAAERRGLELTILAREAELRALRAQVDPHFLFNSLHSISALTTADPAGARRMAIALADFLRDTLRLGALERVPLAVELALARRYLGIEQTRFGHRLHVEMPEQVTVPPALVPPLLLQPLVENAVRHGIAHLVDGGTVRIEAVRDGGRLVLRVRNPIDAARPAPQGTGVGLANVRERLAMRYGGAARLAADERDGAFEVILTLPWEQQAGSTDGDAGVLPRDQAVGVP